VLAKPRKDLRPIATKGVQRPLEVVKPQPLAKRLDLWVIPRRKEGEAVPVALDPVPNVNLQEAPK
jgi:hypothetical protein